MFGSLMFAMIPFPSIDTGYPIWHDFCPVISMWDDQPKSKLQSRRCTDAS